MDMDRFLTVQRCKLEEDKDRLSNKSPVPCNYFADCIPKNEKPTKNCNEIVGQHKQCNAKANIIDFQPKVNDPPVLAGVVLSPKTTQKTCTNYTMATSLSMQNQQNAQQADDFKIHDNLGRKYCETKHENNATKCAKNLANLNERQCAEADIIFNKRGNKDDMEQWVSDTFYSYFPGYNNENKKRQDILRDRQLEYQQNFLKHQMIEAAANSAKKKHPHNQPPENGERNIPDTNSKPLTSRSTDKTELEIIVNNPNYEAKSPRPGSARHKLLQDLKHTEISNIVNSDGVTERNRRNTEVEMAKKKDYQKELMAQIEEKRRTIEVLKEKERRQEEALTRKLQEQLKTMHLQEELEKERMRADKVRFDSEQNRLMREHLLTKLENDAKLLTSARKPRSENDKVTPEENKVYKYFSNSARHEFRREPVTELPAFHLDLPQSSSHRKKCFQNDNHYNICPFCDSPLKNYESWCLNCERKIFKTNETDHKNLVCEKCKKIYEVCYDCDKNNESNSIHCEKKQNFCTTCRKGMCSNCIETISVARDKTKAESERSFEILEINYPEDDEEDQPVGNDLNNNHDHSRPPYSMNIDRNSIFHHDFDRTKFYDDDNNIEMIRQETDKRLSRYLKNYGDLACKSLRDRSTQTTPDSASRRDIVMVEENNLSMPLLREMPRMTRKESNLQQDERKKKGTRIENLARRWEVPAVQKHTITTHSPKILTQLGAIRKQLQSEQFQLDY